MVATRFSIALVLGCLAVQAADQPAVQSGTEPAQANSAAVAAKPDQPGSALPQSPLEKWQSAAEKGEVWAQFNLGLAYHIGNQVPKNELEAVKWYRAAADRGYAPAQANLGYCYETGFGVAVDHAEAVKWYQLAAVQGNPFAQYNLAKKYQSGPGVALDPKAAEKWFRLAAQQNFVPAFFSLGQIFANEFTGMPNYAEAIKWFRMAAEQGYAPAQHAIGYLYATGKAGQTNHFEAVRWYNLAASRDFADSHYNLGLAYESGLGVPQNLIAAVNHFRTAADSGHPQAQYSLGVCYYEGKGVGVDFVQAYKWWNLAAVQGLPEANSSREILARLMTDKQIRQAQEEAGKFVARAKPKSDPVGLLQIASAETTSVKRIATGFVVSEDGFVITNLRSITGATNLTVVTESGSFPASVHRAEPLNDLVLLKIEGSFRPLPIAASRELAVGAPITALGFDGLNPGQFSPKIARGSVSSLLGNQADPRQLSLEPRLPNTYGGAAVLNERGQVIGVTLAHGESAAESEPGAEAAQVTYALKSDYLIAFLRPLEPEVRWVPDHSKTALIPEQVVSRARAGTVLILVM